MRNGFTIAPVVITILGVMLFTACSGGDEAPVELPETPVLVGQGRYALITEEYVRFHELPDLMEPVIGHGRAGDVLEVSGTTADRQWTAVHVQAGRGWVQSIHIRRFSNRRQAANARSLLDE
ncbi:MAG: hypothetical protein WD492_17640 [Alkalispirochaeta sp.]